MTRPGPAELSRGEWLAWACWVSGMSRQQIAYSLGCSFHTVHTQIRRGRAKIGAGPYDRMTINHERTPMPEQMLNVETLQAVIGRRVPGARVRTTHIESRDQLEIEVRLDLGAQLKLDTRHVHQDGALEATVRRIVAELERLGLEAFADRILEEHGDLVGKLEEKQHRIEQLEQQLTDQASIAKALAAKINHE